jgi:uncharacterized protein (UPF0332 family)
MKQKRGVSLTDPSENLAQAYLAKARDALEVMRTLEDKSYSWAVSSCYYTMYYSVYAILMRLGIKSEIHSCTITLMRYVLSDIFVENDAKIFERAFESRIENQYYTVVLPESQKQYDLFDHAPRFYTIAQDHLISIKAADIRRKRESISEITRT